MKKILCVVLLCVMSYLIFAQKNKYEFRDLVFQCFEKLDDGKSDIEVKKWLKANFKIVENSEYYVIKGLPYGFNTNVYFHPTKIVFEQENVSSFEDLDNINRAIASAINAFKMFDYLDVVNYDYKIYDIHRRKTWRMTTDLNPYQGKAWLTIKGDVKIYKSKEQVAKEKKETEEAKKRLEEEKKREETRKLKERIEQEQKEIRVKEVSSNIVKSISSIDSLVKVYVVNALIEDAFEDFMTGTEKQCYHPKVFLCIDSVKGVQIVTIEVNNKDRVIDKDLYSISTNKQKYLRYNDLDYYLADDKIFAYTYSNADITIKSSKTEVKNKNGKLKFDKHYQEPPSEIKEWCSKNLTENGNFIIRYTNCDNRYTTTKTKIQ